MQKLKLDEIKKDVPKSYIVTFPSYKSYNPNPKKIQDIPESTFGLVEFSMVLAIMIAMIFVILPTLYLISQGM